MYKNYNSINSNKKRIKKFLNQYSGGKAHDYRHVNNTRCIRTIDAYNITIYKENNIRDKDKGMIVERWNIIYKLGKYIQNPRTNKAMQYRTNTQIRVIKVVSCKSRKFKTRRVE